MGHAERAKHLADPADAERFARLHEHQARQSLPCVDRGTSPNWELIERDEQDVLARCRESEIPLSSVRIERDLTGLAILVTCKLPD